MKKNKCLYLVVVATQLLHTFSAQIVSADVRVPKFFGDHMVVQQQMPVRIWGWADPGEEVHVSFSEQSATATADQEGNWSVTLPAMAASKTPLTMTIAGQNTIELKDVLIGEVWLCSGQSNMEWTVRQCGNAAEEIANADHPLIRHIKIPKRPSPTPQIDVDAEWQVCSPETTAGFTAAGYYTAVNLLKELDVPIGLVNSTWGGTRIEPWTCLEGFKSVESLEELYQSTRTRTPGTDSYKKLFTEHCAAIDHWLAEARSRVETREIIPRSPEFPDALRPLSGSGDATALYNGMIHPLVGLPIRGALWYQGESNRRDGMVYFEKKKALIQGWRELWGQGDFPFYFVQIAPFQYGQENPEMLAEFWEAQAETQSLVNTGMVITNDIATLNDIHPPNKQEVGRRLALLALKDLYGREDLVARSPMFESLEVVSGKLKVNFTRTGGKLETRDGDAPTHFEIAGVGSNGFQPATATIEGNSVILHADTVESPVAFRFAWHKLAEPNLTGATGLPVGAARGGDVPSFLELLPDSQAYKLVYELDLADLGPEVRYTVDNRNDFDSFDRIGYLVELQSSEHGDQKVFVSMKAFTEDINKIGIPTVKSGASFQQSVREMNVFATDKRLATKTRIETGNIEFWPNNYAADNSANVHGATDNKYDFGDQIRGAADGYGSMQVHNFGNKTTVFAINHWSEGPKADVGIGNSDGPTSDWTFSRNAEIYDHKRLRIYIRPN